MDPKRPQLPEHPANKHGGVPSQRPPDPYNSGPPTPGTEMRGGGFQPPPYHHQGSNPGGGYGGQGGGYNYRGGPPMPYGKQFTVKYLLTDHIRRVSYLGVQE